MKISKSEFKQIIENESSLTSFGVNPLLQIKSFKKLSLAEARKELDHERIEFLSRFGEFKICCHWLSKFKKIKTPQYSSYFLKHVVEKLADEYVCNGALIAAAIFLDIPIKYNDESPNVSVAISKRCPYLKKVGHVV